VISIERYRTLVDVARRRLAALDFTNVEIVAGDGLEGVPSGAPYDRILVTAAAESIPQALIDQLGEGGVMVLPHGPHDGPQSIVRITKGPAGLRQETLIAVRFVPLLPGQAREL
jgi:protein-L-isoaspartate(D-aspartate) O-methyltransferase